MVMAQSNVAPETPSPSGQGALASRVLSESASTGMDCHSPWSPISCSAMSACGAVVYSVHEAGRTASFPIEVAELPEPGPADAGLTIAPELPPPRV